MEEICANLVTRLNACGITTDIAYMRSVVVYAQNSKCENIEDFIDTMANHIIGKVKFPVDASLDIINLTISIINKVLTEEFSKYLMKRINEGLLYENNSDFEPTSKSM